MALMAPSPIAVISLPSMRVPVDVAETEMTVFVPVPRIWLFVSVKSFTSSLTWTKWGEPMRSGSSRQLLNDTASARDAL